ncbi:MAG: FAD-dependent oxidoreductase [Dehalococcoidales bacterium]|nr:FAD-dependent oxidoreductase [Dehalococcoidales bacterium]
MKQLETDVAVIGAGTAGLASAVATAENNVRVAIFEKSSTTGGTGNMAMGPFAVESRLQRIKQVPLTREQAFKIFMDYTHWRVDAQLVSAYINKSADTIDWLEQMGVEFIEPEAYFPGANYTWHVVKPASGRRGPMAAATMMKALTNSAHELGVKIYLQTPVNKILKADGRIVGLIARDKDNEEVEIKAKAVVIASGGFGDNPEMIKKYLGYEWGKDIYSMRIPGMVGDGIQMAWDVGAGREGMNMELTYNMPMMAEITKVFADPSSTAVAMGLNSLNQPSLMVNLLGNRFLNEEIMGNTTFTGNAIARQKGHCAFIIFDDNARKIYEEVGLDHVFCMNPVTRAENLGDLIKQAIEQKNENVFMANSIEDLAHQTGINPDNLHKTVTEYNKACDRGRDDIFHKDARYLRPISQPPIYAARYFPSAYGSLGGIKINEKTEVLTNDFEIIPGLYAAGVDANAIYGDSYVFVLPGNTLGFALNSGRLAGENAADYIETLK